MCDIFLKPDVHFLLRGKSVLFLGDSIMRNIYKDLIWLTDPSTDGTLIPTRHMCAKGEDRFCHDRKIEGSRLTAGRDYVEYRDYYLERGPNGEKLDLQYSFMFITRCFSSQLREFLREYPSKCGSYPDVIVINSALWDINRWGIDGIEKFRHNIFELMSNLQRIIERDRQDYVQVIWMTTPPISTEIRGGFMIQQIEFQRHSMRFNIMESNQYAANMAASFGFDVLDMHAYMCNQINRRAADGIHWNPDAVRMQVNIILTHFCLSRRIPLPNRWNTGLPGNTRNLLLEEAKARAEVALTDLKVRSAPLMPKRREDSPHREGQRKYAHARRRK